MLQNNQIGAKASDTSTPSSVNQGITKFIIANSGITSQLNMPNTSKPVNIASGVGSQSILLASPTKALAFPKNLLVGGTQQIIKPAPGTPNKQAFYVLSPVKPASKVTTVIPAVKSPKHRPIAPASNTAFSSVLTTKIPTTSTVTSSAVSFTKNIQIQQQSPTKLILKPVVSTVTASVASTTASSSTVSVLPVTTTQTPTTVSTQQAQIPGNKLHYVRLVSAPTTASATAAATVVTKPTVLPVTSTARSILASAQTAAPLTAVSSDGQIRLNVSVPNTTKTVHTKTVQKILFPAPTMAQMASAKQNAVQLNQVGQLPAGAIIPLGGTAQGYVVVPANYIGQPQVQTTVAQVVFKNVSSSNVQNTTAVATATATSSSAGDIQHTNIRPITISTSTTANLTSFVPIAPSGSVNMVSPAIQQQQQASPPIPSQHHQSPFFSSEHISSSCEARPRKPCNCTKSQCLKLYCECFAKGEFCNTCNCINCYNNLAHEVERQKAIKACRDRNPLAFRPKIGKSQGCEQERRHTKGCNCKRSGCLKNYCECYEAKILCTNLCRCFGCKNFEDSSEKKTLLHLADAAEVRVKQQAAAKANLSSQFIMSAKPTMGGRKGGKLPVSFINDEVIQKTILCMLAQAHAAEEEGLNETDSERNILQEFGQCLRTLISHAEEAADSESDNDLND